MKDLIKEYVKKVITDRIDLEELHKKLQKLGITLKVSEENYKQIHEILKNYKNNK